MAIQETPVGIDLGTTFSAIAYLDNQGRPCTIPNSEGELTTPSVVYFDRDEIIVGTEAQFAGENNLDRLARSAKRDMGSVRYRKTILNQSLPPEIIQSLVLKRLKSDAALMLGDFTKAVITVPAYFNEPRRKATQDAGCLAGLDVIDIINEPTAAALCYGVQRGFLNQKGEAAEKEVVLVYDLGGGTFDVTLMEINGSQFKAIATAGDVYLGGIDWDQRIYEFAEAQIAAQHSLDFESDGVLQEKLRNQCVRAKKALTARKETVIRFEHAGERYSVELSRKQFEEFTQDLLERTRLTTDRLLRDAKLGWSQLTRLLLVGGSTRMPMVMDMLEKESGLVVDRSLSPDEAVAHGAAIYAGILLNYGPIAGKGISVSNVNSHDLGVLGIDPKTREPKRRVVIPRNHELPARSVKKFVTSRDAQRSIVVQIVEGGTDEGLGATTIGKCVVDDLPADIKKGTEVLVCFNYLSSGRIEIVAQIPSLKLKANSVIDRASGMTDVEISDWKERIDSGKLISEPVTPDEPEDIEEYVEVVVAEESGSDLFVPNLMDSTKKISQLTIDEIAVTTAPPLNFEVSANANKKTEPTGKQAPPKKAERFSRKPAAPVKATAPAKPPAPRKPVAPAKSTAPVKPISRPMANPGAKPSATSPPKPTAPAKKTPQPATSLSAVVLDELPKNPLADFDVNENSGIFAIGDEVAKPKIGNSMLDFLKDVSDDDKDSSPSESALDFFVDPDKKSDPSEISNFHLDI